MTQLTPEDVATAVRLVKKETCRGFATVADTAKMLGVRKMDVLLYMEQYPKLFHAEQRHRVKHVKVTVHGWGALRGQKWKEDRVVDGASLGLCFIEAYTTPEDNPWNPEWLVAAKEKYTKTLWLTGVNNYGDILGYCFTEDKRPSSLQEGQVYADNRQNPWLWRNTHEKLEAAKALGGCKEKSYIMGSFGDSYHRNEPYGVTAESRAILESAGWTLL